MVTISAAWNVRDRDLVGKDDAGNEYYNSVGTDVKGNRVLIGRSQTATTPGQLLLLSLAGCICSGVSRILRQARQPVEDVQVSATGYQQADFPKPFERIEVLVTIYGGPIEPKTLERALQLVQEKYCIVGLTLKQSPQVDITAVVRPAV